MSETNPFEELLYDICVRMGYCGGPGRVTDYVPEHGRVSAQQFVDWIFLADGMSPTEENFNHRPILEALFIKHMGADIVDARILRYSYWEE